jgi:hypothetical protein
MRSSRFFAFVIVLVTAALLILPQNIGGYGTEIGLWQDQEWVPDALSRRVGMDPLPMNTTHGLTQDWDRTGNNRNIGWQARTCSEEEATLYVKWGLISACLAMSCIAMRRGFLERVFAGAFSESRQFKILFAVMGWKFTTSAIACAFFLSMCTYRASAGLPAGLGACAVWELAWWICISADVIYLMRPRKGEMVNTFRFAYRTGLLAGFHFLLLALFISGFDFDGRGTFLHESSTYQSFRADTGSRLVPAPSVLPIQKKIRRLTDAMKCAAGCEAVARDIFPDSNDPLGYRPVNLAISKCSVHFRNTTSTGAPAETFRYHLYGANERTPTLDLASGIEVIHNLDYFDANPGKVKRTDAINISVINRQLTGSQIQYSIGQCKFVIEVPSMIRNRTFLLPNITITGTPEDDKTSSMLDTDVVRSMIPLNFGGNTLTVSGSYRQVHFQSLKLGYVDIDLDAGDIAIKNLVFVNNTVHQIIQGDVTEYIGPAMNSTGTKFADEYTPCVFPWTRDFAEPLYAGLKVEPAFYTGCVQASKSFKEYFGMKGTDAMGWCSTTGHFDVNSTDADWGFCGPTTFDSNPNHDRVSSISTAQGDVWLTTDQSLELELEVRDNVYCLKAYNMTMVDIPCAHDDAVASNGSMTNRTNGTAFGGGAMNGSTAAMSTSTTQTDSLTTCKRVIMCSEDDCGERTRVRANGTTNFLHNVVQTFPGLKVTAERGGFYGKVTRPQTKDATVCNECTECQRDQCGMTPGSVLPPADRRCMVPEHCGASTNSTEAPVLAFLTVLADGDDDTTPATTSGCTGGQCSSISSCVPSEGDFLTCLDGSKCNPFVNASDGILPSPLGWSCCNDHGGRAKCPNSAATPRMMCAKPNSCAGGQDYCCNSLSEGGCDREGGPRNCLDNLVFKGGAFLEAEAAAQAAGMGSAILFDSSSVEKLQGIQRYLQSTQDKDAVVMIDLHTPGSTFGRFMFTNRPYFLQMHPAFLSGVSFQLIRPVYSELQVRLQPGICPMVDLELDGISDEYLSTHTTWENIGDIWKLLNDTIALTSEQRLVLRTFLPQEVEDTATVDQIWSDTGDSITFIKGQVDPATPDEPAPLFPERVKIEMVPLATMALSLLLAIITGLVGTAIANRYVFSETGMLAAWSDKSTGRRQAEFRALKQKRKQDKADEMLAGGIPAAWSVTADAGDSLSSGDVDQRQIWYRGLFWNRQATVPASYLQEGGRLCVRREGLHPFASIEMAVLAARCFFCNSVAAYLGSMEWPGWQLNADNIRQSNGQLVGEARASGRHAAVSTASKVLNAVPVEKLRESYERFCKKHQLQVQVITVASHRLTFLSYGLDLFQESALDPDDKTDCTEFRGLRWKLAAEVVNDANASDTRAASLADDEGLADEAGIAVHAAHSEEDEEHNSVRRFILQSCKLTSVVADVITAKSFASEYAVFLTDHRQEAEAKEEHLASFDEEVEHGFRTFRRLGVVVADRQTKVFVGGLRNVADQQAGPAVDDSDNEEEVKDLSLVGALSMAGQERFENWTRDMFLDYKRCFPYKHEYEIEVVPCSFLTHYSRGKIALLNLFFYRLFAHVFQPGAILFYETAVVIIQSMIVLLIGIVPVAAALVTEIDITASSPYLSSEDQMSSAMLLAPNFGEAGEKIWFVSMLPEEFSMDGVGFRFHFMHRVVLAFSVWWYAVAFLELIIFYWNWAPHVYQKEYRIERVYVMLWTRYFVNNVFYYSFLMVCATSIATIFMFVAWCGLAAVLNPDKYLPYAAAAGAFVTFMVAKIAYLKKTRKDMEQRVLAAVAVKMDHVVQGTFSVVEDQLDDLKEKAQSLADDATRTMHLALPGFDPAIIIQLRNGDTSGLISWLASQGVGEEISAALLALSSNPIDANAMAKAAAMFAAKNGVPGNLAEGMTKVVLAATAPLEGVVDGVDEKKLRKAAIITASRDLIVSVLPQLDAPAVDAVLAIITGGGGMTELVEKIQQTLFSEEAIRAIAQQGKEPLESLLVTLFSLPPTLVQSVFAIASTIAEQGAGAVYDDAVAEAASRAAAAAPKMTDELLRAAEALGKTTGVPAAMTQLAVRLLLELSAAAKRQVGEQEMRALLCGVRAGNLQKELKKLSETAVGDVTGAVKDLVSAFDVGSASHAALRIAAGGPEAQAISEQISVPVAAVRLSLCLSVVAVQQRQVRQGGSSIKVSSPQGTGKKAVSLSTAASDVELTQQAGKIAADILLEVVFDTSAADLEAMAARAVKQMEARAREAKQIVAQAEAKAVEFVEYVRPLCRVAMEVVLAGKLTPAQEEALGEIAMSAIYDILAANGIDHQTISSLRHTLKVMQRARNASSAAAAFGEILPEFADEINAISLEISMYWDASKHWEGELVCSSCNKPYESASVWCFDCECGKFHRLGKATTSADRADDSKALLLAAVRTVVAVAHSIATRKPAGAAIAALAYMHLVYVVTQSPPAQQAQDLSAALQFTARAARRGAGALGPLAEKAVAIMQSRGMLPEELLDVLGVQKLRQLALIVGNLLERGFVVDLDSIDAEVDKAIEQVQGTAEAEMRKQRQQLVLMIKMSLEAAAAKAQAAAVDAADAAQSAAAGAIDSAGLAAGAGLVRSLDKVQVAALLVDVAMDGDVEGLKRELVRAMQENIQRELLAHKGLLVRKAVDLTLTVLERECGPGGPDANQRAVLGCVRELCTGVDAAGQPKAAGDSVTGAVQSVLESSGVRGVDVSGVAAAFQSHTPEEMATECMKRTAQFALQATGASGPFKEVCNALRLPPTLVRLCLAVVSQDKRAIRTQMATVMGFALKKVEEVKTEVEQVARAEADKLKAQVEAEADKLQAAALSQLDVVQRLVGTYDQSGALTKLVYAIARGSVEEDVKNCIEEFKAELMREKLDIERLVEDGDKQGLVNELRQVLGQVNQEVAEMGAPLIAAIIFFAHEASKPGANREYMAFDLLLAVVDAYKADGSTDVRWSVTFISFVRDMTVGDEKAKAVAAAQLKQQGVQIMVENVAPQLMKLKKELGLEPQHMALFQQFVRLAMTGDKAAFVEVTNNTMICIIQSLGLNGNIESMLVTTTELAVALVRGGTTLEELTSQTTAAATDEGKRQLKRAKFEAKRAIRELLTRLLQQLLNFDIAVAGGVDQAKSAAKSQAEAVMASDVMQAALSAVACLANNEPEVAMEKIAQAAALKLTIVLGDASPDLRDLVSQPITASAIDAVLNAAAQAADGDMDNLSASISKAVTGIAQVGVAVLLQKTLPVLPAATAGVAAAKRSSDCIKGASFATALFASAAEQMESGISKADACKGLVSTLCPYLFPEIDEKMIQLVFNAALGDFSQLDGEAKKFRGAVLALKLALGVSMATSATKDHELSARGKNEQRIVLKLIKDYIPDHVVQKKQMYELVHGVQKLVDGDFLSSEWKTAGGEMHDLATTLHEEACGIRDNARPERAKVMGEAMLALSSGKSSATRFFLYNYAKQFKLGRSRVLGVYRILRGVDETPDWNVDEVSKRLHLNSTMAGALVNLSSESSEKRLDAVRHVCSSVKMKKERLNLLSDVLSLAKVFKRHGGVYGLEKRSGFSVLGPIQTGTNHSHDNDKLPLITSRGLVHLAKKVLLSEKQTKAALLLYTGNVYFTQNGQKHDIGHDEKVAKASLERANCAKHSTESLPPGVVLFKARQRAMLALLPFDTSGVDMYPELRRSVLYGTPLPVHKDELRPAEARAALSNLKKAGQGGQGSSRLVDPMAQAFLNRMSGVDKAVRICQMKRMDNVREVNTSLFSTPDLDSALDIVDVLAEAGMGMAGAGRDMASPMAGQIGRRLDAAADAAEAAIADSRMGVSSRTLTGAIKSAAADAASSIQDVGGSALEIVDGAVDSVADVGAGALERSGFNSAVGGVANELTDALGDVGKDLQDGTARLATSGKAAMTAQRKGMLETMTSTYESYKRTVDHEIRRFTERHKSKPIKPEGVTLLRALAVALHQTAQSDDGFPELDRMESLARSCSLPVHLFALLWDAVSGDACRLFNLRAIVGNMEERLDLAVSTPDLLSLKFSSGESRINERLEPRNFLLLRNKGPQGLVTEELPATFEFSERRMKTIRVLLGCSNRQLDEFARRVVLNSQLVELGEAGLAELIRLEKPDDDPRQHPRKGKSTRRGMPDWAMDVRWSGVQVDKQQMMALMPGGYISEGAAGSLDSGSFKLKKMAYRPSHATINKVAADLLSEMEEHQAPEEKKLKLKRLANALDGSSGGGDMDAVQVQLRELIRGRSSATHALGIYARAGGEGRALQHLLRSGAVSAFVADSGDGSSRGAWKSTPNTPGGFEMHLDNLLKLQIPQSKIGEKEVPARDPRVCLTKIALAIALTRSNSIPVSTALQVLEKQLQNLQQMANSGNLFQNANWWVKPLVTGITVGVITGLVMHAEGFEQEYSLHVGLVTFGGVFVIGCCYARKYFSIVRSYLYAAVVVILRTFGMKKLAVAELAGEKVTGLQQLLSDPNGLRRLNQVLEAIIYRAADDAVGVQISSQQLASRWFQSKVAADVCDMSVPDFTIRSLKAVQKVAVSIGAKPSVLTAMAALCTENRSQAMLEEIRPLTRVLGIPKDAEDGLLLMLPLLAPVDTVNFNSADALSPTESQTDLLTPFAANKARVRADVLQTAAQRMAVPLQLLQAALMTASGFSLTGAAVRELTEETLSMVARQYLQELGSKLGRTYYSQRGVHCLDDLRVLREIRAAKAKADKNGGPRTCGGFGRGDHAADPAAGSAAAGSFNLDGALPQALPAGVVLKLMQLMHGRLAEEITAPLNDYFKKGLLLVLPLALPVPQREVFTLRNTCLVLGTEVVRRLPGRSRLSPEALLYARQPFKTVTRLLLSGTGDASALEGLWSAMALLCRQPAPSVEDSGDSDSALFETLLATPKVRCEALQKLVQVCGKAIVAATDLVGVTDAHTDESLRDRWTLSEPLMDPCGKSELLVRTVWDELEDISARGNEASETERHALALNALLVTAVRELLEGAPVDVSRVTPWPRGGERSWEARLGIHQDLVGAQAQAIVSHLLLLGRGGPIYMHTGFLARVLFCPESSAAQRSAEQHAGEEKPRKSMPAPPGTLPPRREKAPAPSTKTPSTNLSATDVETQRRLCFAVLALAAGDLRAIMSEQGKSRNSYPHTVTTSGMRELLFVIGLQFSPRGVVSREALREACARVIGVAWHRKARRATSGGRLEVEEGPATGRAAAEQERTKVLGTARATNVLISWHAKKEIQRAKREVDFARAVAVELCLVRHGHRAVRMLATRLPEGTCVQEDEGRPVSQAGFASCVSRPGSSFSRPGTNLGASRPTSDLGARPMTGRPETAPPVEARPATDRGTPVPPLLSEMWVTYEDSPTGVPVSGFSEILEEALRPRGRRRARRTRVLRATTRADLRQLFALAHSATDDSDEHVLRALQQVTPPRGSDQLRFTMTLARAQAAVRVILNDRPGKESDAILLRSQRRSQEQVNVVLAALQTAGSSKVDKGRFVNAFFHCKPSPGQRMAFLHRLMTDSTGGMKELIVDAFPDGANLGIEEGGSAGANPASAGAGAREQMAAAWGTGSSSLEGAEFMHLLFSMCGMPSPACATPDDNVAMKRVYALLQLAAGARSRGKNCRLLFDDLCNLCEDGVPAESRKRAWGLIGTMHRRLPAMGRQAATALYVNDQLVDGVTSASRKFAKSPAGRDRLRRSQGYVSAGLSNHEGPTIPTTSVPRMQAVWDWLTESADTTFSGLRAVNKATGSDALAFGEQVSCTVGQLRQAMLGDHVAFAELVRDTHELAQGWTSHTKKLGVKVNGLVARIDTDVPQFEMPFVECCLQFAHGGFTEAEEGFRSFLCAHTAGRNKSTMRQVLCGKEVVGLESAGSSPVLVDEQFPGLLALMLHTDFAVDAMAFKTSSIEELQQTGTPGNPLQPPPARAKEGGASEDMYALRGLKGDRQDQYELLSALLHAPGVRSDKLMRTGKDSQDSHTTMLLRFAVLGEVDQLALRVVTKFKFMRELLCELTVDHFGGARTNAEGERMNRSLRKLMLPPAIKSQLDKNPLGNQQWLDTAKDSWLDFSGTLLYVTLNSGFDSRQWLQNMMALSAERPYNPVTKKAMSKNTGEALSNLGRAFGICCVHDDVPHTDEQHPVLLLAKMHGILSLVVGGEPSFTAWHEMAEGGLAWSRLHHATVQKREFGTNENEYWLSKVASGSHTDRFLPGAALGGQFSLADALTLVDWRDGASSKPRHEALCKLLRTVAPSIGFPQVAALNTSRERKAGGKLGAGGEQATGTDAADDAAAAAAAEGASGEPCSATQMADMAAVRAAGKVGSAASHVADQHPAVALLLSLVGGDVSQVDEAVVGVMRKYARRLLPPGADVAVASAADMAGIAESVFQLLRSLQRLCSLLGGSLVDDGRGSSRAVSNGEVVIPPGQLALQEVDTLLRHWHLAATLLARLCKNSGADELALPTDMSQVASVLRAVISLATLDFERFAIAASKHTGIHPKMAPRLQRVMQVVQVHLKAVAPKKEVEEAKEHKSVHELFQDFAGTDSQIDFVEFRVFCRHMKLICTDARYHELFVLADPNGNGQIDRFEFDKAIAIIKEDAAGDTITKMGVSAVSLVLGFVGACLYLAFLFLFIMLGITAFTTGGSFGAVINSMTPMLAAGGMDSSRKPADEEETAAKVEDSINTSMGTGNETTS